MKHMKQKKPDQDRPEQLHAPAKQRSQPVRGADTSQALWSIGAVIAFAIVLGVTLYGIDSRGTQTIASPPAASPPALASESPITETTGQGGSREHNGDGDAAK